MTIDSLSNGTEPVLSSGAVGAGVADVVGVVFDATRFDSVRFLASLGAVVDTSIVTLKAQTGLLADGSDMTDVAGCTTAGFTSSGATPASNKFVSLDVRRPLKKYVRAVLSRTVANATVNFIIAEGYNARTEPIVSSTVVARKDAQG